MVVNTLSVPKVILESAEPGDRRLRDEAVFTRNGFHNKAWGHRARGAPQVMKNNVMNPNGVPQETAKRSSMMVPTVTLLRQTGKHIVLVLWNPVGVRLNQFATSGAP